MIKDLSKIKPKCRACGNRLVGAAGCNNRYCPKGSPRIEGLAEQLKEDYPTWIPLWKQEDCPYCRFDPCICEQRESNNPFED